MRKILTLANVVNMWYYRLYKIMREYHNFSNQSGSRRRTLHVEMIADEPKNSHVPLDRAVLGRQQGGPVEGMRATQNQLLR